MRLLFFFAKDFMSQWSQNNWVKATNSSKREWMKTFRCLLFHIRTTMEANWQLKMHNFQCSFCIRWTCAAKLKSTWCVCNKRKAFRKIVFPRRKCLNVKKNFHSKSAISKVYVGSRKTRSSLRLRRDKRYIYDVIFRSFSTVFLMIAIIAAHADISWVAWGSICINDEEDNFRCRALSGLSQTSQFTRSRQNSFFIVQGLVSNQQSHSINWNEINVTKIFNNVWCYIIKLNWE